MIYVVYTFAIFGATVFLGLFGILSWLMYEYDHDDPRLHGDECPCDRCQDAT